MHSPQLVEVQSRFIRLWRILTFRVAEFFNLDFERGSSLFQGRFAFGIL